ncbi:MAG: CHAT domain-containing protein, partial [Pseudomonadota bacterium]|nr:CHAT domain-containing protein [Pseudomonadota bacterium]
SIFKLLGDVVPAAGLPLKFLLALIAEHEDPSTLPGLEAQTPGSPLIRTLNLPQLKVRADLTVISGDTESSGFLGRIKELALDQFFDDESDIIVNTGAMYGGLARVDGGRFHLERGAAVNHFAYFDNVASVRKLAEGLLRLDGSQAGFQPISEAKQKEPIARAVLQRAAPGPRPAVFILPGIMGSHLSIDDKRIWLAIGQLMLGGLGDLELNGADVKADPYLEDYYEELAEYLAQTHEVVRFPYDWRRSVMEAGERLAAAIAGKLDQLASVDQPVRIVAHSMGGLVVRAMIARHNDIWRRMIAHPRSRFVMLGTPNGGSHEIVRLLTGRATTLHNLALLDLRRGARGLLKIISGFPGVLELLPIVNNFECFDPQFWKDLRRNDEDQRFSWQPPKDADLRQARNARQEMEKVALSSERTVYVTGAAAATPVGYRLQTEFDYDGVRSHWQTLVFEANGLGDGQVPWQTGIPAGIKAWYLDDVVHGELPAHAPAFPAYVELLETGNTSRLSMTPPAGARATAASPAFDMPLELPPNLPDERDLAASVVGGRPPRRVRAPLRLPKAKVSITHGDLVFARYPVAVGHYRGDTIVSAEAYLDRALDHQLRNRSRLDLYPGALGTFEAFLQTDRYRKPGGAIVVGLGQVGELSPGRLASGFASAALSYALQVKECPDDRFGGAAGVPRHARITSLLIGTGAAGIAVRDSIASILRGVAAANRRLDEIGLSSEVWIDEIEFIELYQDIAIGAASALESTLLDGELSGYFICPERCICEGPGGRRRALFDSSPEWWSRLEIVYDKKRDELRFISLTDRARAEETLVAGQRLLADDFIRRSIRETRFDRDISRTLFEMLVPNRLKETAPNQDKLVLIVDDVSGSYPWELLEDRWSFGGKPVAVMSGMLRQLKTAVFRERPAMPFMNNAYVVGNPVLPAGELPGAEREAIAVADFLHKHGFAVTREIHSGAADILAGLHAEGYRVLHLAGHGVHEIEIDEQMPGPCALCEQPLPKTAKKISGMVIGKGIFLTPGDVEQMRYVPELVFINCCHLGNLGSAADATSWTRYSALAANLGAQFIRMGVKAVVAAGWAVDDSAAETFAISLYTHLFDADRFGDAVRAAREETFDKHGATNTWGAYQCYGDPSYRLRLPRDTESQRTPGPYVSPAQVVIDLDNLTSRARSTGGKIKDAQAIEQAVKKQRNDWLERAEVAAALGIAYGELGAFEDAIAHLGVALHAGKAEITVRAIEQRANFKTRLAVANVRKAKNASERHDATQLIDDAIADLNRLNEWDDWGTSIERLNLLGSSYKRKAQIAAASAGSGARSRRQAANARGQALRKMADYYRKSHEKVQEKDCRKFDPYPLLNWLTAEVLLAWPALPEKKKMKEIEGWLEQVKAYAEKENEPRDFWNSIVSADCDLLRALVGQTLVEDKDNIIKAFVGARRGGSPRELGSAREHLDFIAEILASADDGMNEQALALREIAERLANLPN